MHTGRLATKNSSVIHSNEATKYHTLTYRWSTRLFMSVYNTGSTMSAKPAKIKRSICHGISKNSMPSLQPMAMAPKPALMPALSKEPPSITQGAPTKRVRSKRGNTHTMTAKHALDDQP